MSGRASSVAQLRSQLSNRDLAIVSSVTEFRFLTGRQLQVLHFDGQHNTTASSARSCRRVLNRLTSLHILQRLDRRVGGIRAGSASFVYCLDFAGHRLTASGRERHGHWQPSQTFMDHALAIADLFVRVVIASHAGRLQLVRYETEPQTWRTIPGYGTNDILRPDLSLVLTHGELEYHWRVEVDLATEHAGTIRRKCEQYLRYWQSGAAGDDAEVFPRVAWLTTSPTRADRIREIAEQAQGDVPLFEVGLLDRPLDVLLPDRGSA
jgi:hypothetical protein